MARLLPCKRRATGEPYPPAPGWITISSLFRSDSRISFPVRIVFSFPRLKSAESLTLFVVSGCLRACHSYACAWPVVRLSGGGVDALVSIFRILLSDFWFRFPVVLFDPTSGLWVGVAVGGHAVPTSALFDHYFFSFPL